MSETPKPSFVVHLNVHTIGPEFETQSPEQFRTYVESLKELKNMGKEKKAPRIKKVKTTHSVDESTKLCTLCGKKPRNPAATCPGPKKLEKSDANETSLLTANTAVVEPTSA